MLPSSTFETVPPFTGSHMVIDLFGCRGLAEPAIVEEALRAAVSASGATLLDLTLHHFGDEHGVTGVALLAESHISIHTWPEYGYAAADIFLCGRNHDLNGALAALADELGAERHEWQSIKRGYALGNLLPQITTRPPT